MEFFDLEVGSLTAATWSGVGAMSKYICSQMENKANVKQTQTLQNKTLQPATLK